MILFSITRVIPIINASLFTMLPYNRNMLNSEHHHIQSTNPNDSSKTQLDTSLKKYHSILPDLATGWRPKNAKIAAPILITYQDDLNEWAFKSGLHSLNRLVYIGPRHDNSYKFHSLTQHGYNVRYGINCEEVPSKLKKQLQEFTMKSNNRKNFFSGMNPNLERELQFEANFQSGNLDLVLKVAPTEYNLFLRPDTNTRGHMQWFYFRVCNQAYPYQKVRINICNNRKAGVLYARGMKPYIFSRYASGKKIKWQQGGQNVEYKRLSEKENAFVYDGKCQEVSAELLGKYYCLSFDYTFESPDDEVYFAYCPPFTYSEMKYHVQTLKSKSNPQMGLTITEQNLCTSLTGLQIPVITITNQKIQESQKKCIIATGRFHPGESNGSYAIKGFMDFLVSPEAEYLRSKIVFKIIPMVNPDGVVFGNYRTSLSGKDLNRKFKAKNVQLFPEITNLKNFVCRFKRQQKAKIIYFLDFHGHSIKKNVFLYGPQYDIWSTKYERAKILPKMIASKTDMFRYQSCIFRVAATKKTTARAFMLGMIPYCYTIQSSVGLYRSFKGKQKQNFYLDVEKFEGIGKVIGQSLSETIMKIQKQSNNKKKKRIIQSQQTDHNKQNAFKTIKRITDKELPANWQQSNSKNTSDRQDSRKKEKNDQMKEKLLIKMKQRINEPESQRSLSSKSIRSRQGQQKSLSPSSRAIEKEKSPYLQMQFSQIKQVQGESDGYSEGKSDCQSDDNDFDKEEYKKISGRIMKFIENFNMSVIGERQRKFRLKNKKKLISTNNNRYFIGLRKVSNQDMGMVPSLKHKMLKREFSQKKITTEQKQEMFKSKKLSIYRFDEKSPKI